MRETAANKFKSIASSEQNSGDETFGFHLANRKPMGSSGCCCLWPPWPCDIGSGPAQRTAELLRAPTRAFCNKLWFMGCLWSGWSLCGNEGESVMWLLLREGNKLFQCWRFFVCPHATSAFLLTTWSHLSSPLWSTISRSGLMATSWPPHFARRECRCGPALVLSTLPPLMLLLPALVKCYWIGLFWEINSLSNPRYEPHAESGVMELGDEICGQNLGNVQSRVRWAQS